MNSSPEVIVAAYFELLAADSSVPDGLIGKQLVEEGHDALAALLVSRFGPIVLGRMLMDGMGVQFSDTYLVANGNGSIAEQGSMSTNPYFSALEVGARGHGELAPQVGPRSPEFTAINAALHDGSEPTELVGAPLVMFNGRPLPGSANKVEMAIAKIASSGSKPWWKFW